MTNILRLFFALFISVYINAIYAEEYSEIEKNKEYESAKKAVLDSLIDPESARFGSAALAPGKEPNTGFGCITVNSKNRLGGYAGDSQLALIKKDGKWLVLNDVHMSLEDCFQIVGSAFRANARP